MSRLSGADIQISIRERGSRYLVSWSGPAFARVRDAYKAAFPAHGDACWLPEDRCWSMPLACRQRLEAWVSHTCDPSCVQWISEADEEATGSQTRSSSQSTYGRFDGRRHRHRRGDDDRGVAPTLQEAYRLLCLTSDAPTDLVTTVHHWWARQLHPDTGQGDEQAMAAVNAAVDTIRRDKVT